MTLETREYKLWQEYQERRLGGLSIVMRMLLDGTIGAMTVPEVLPQWFDPMFVPNPSYVLTMRVEPSRARLWPTTSPGQDFASLSAMYGRPVGAFEVGGYLGPRGYEGPATPETIPAKEHFRHFEEPDFK